MPSRTRRSKSATRCMRNCSSKGRKITPSKTMNRRVQSVASSGQYTQTYQFSATQNKLWSCERSKRRNVNGMQMAIWISRMWFTALQKSWKVGEKRFNTDTRFTESIGVAAPRQSKADFQNASGVVLRVFAASRWLSGATPPANSWAPHGIDFLLTPADDKKQPGTFTIGCALSTPRRLTGQYSTKLISRWPKWRTFLACGVWAQRFDPRQFFSRSRRPVEGARGFPSC